MLLTLTTTAAPATDLGYLLAKNPTRAQTFGLSFGSAHVFYPEATEARCTAALLLDVDPVALSRGAEGEARGTLEPYVNDRPYVASSFLSVALAQVFGSALGGRCKERPELARTAIPLEAELPVLPARGGERVVRALFEPLGWAVACEPVALDEAFPGWGRSPYFSVRLRGTATVQALLQHLYVLVPALDDEKHYWVGEDEVEKLVSKGAGWLEAHPEKDLVARRYLRHDRRLTRAALERLRVDEDGEVEEKERDEGAREEQAEARLSLDEQRRLRVVEELRAAGARSVLDLGCGEGRLVRALAEARFERIVGVDVSLRALAVAERRLERLHPSARSRVELLHGSVVYRDPRFEGFDAAALIEVVEHVDPERLPHLERVVFAGARPRTVVVTTPNVEYNARFEGLAQGGFRHGDHRFEWTRAELAAWASRVASERGYDVRLGGVGEEDPALGAPTQLAVFTRRA